MSPRRALITGGGGAIAEALAIRLDRHGYELVLTDINHSRMEEVANRLSRPATLIDADLSTQAGLAELCGRIVEEYSDLDLLVNNAGYIAPGDVTDLSAADIERHVFINLLAPMQLSRVVAEGMCARGRGDILAIVSMGGIIALRGSAAGKTA